MKKTKNVFKVLLISIVELFLISNVCFADVYMPGHEFDRRLPIETAKPKSNNISDYLTENTINIVQILGWILVAMAVFMVVELIVLCINKSKGKSESIKTRKNQIEAILYYTIILAISVALIMLLDIKMKLTCIIVAIYILISLILRIIRKNHTIFLLLSYGFAIMCLITEIIVFLSNTIW